MEVTLIGLTLWSVLGVVFFMYVVSRMNNPNNLKKLGILGLFCGPFVWAVIGVNGFISIILDWVDK